MAALEGYRLSPQQRRVWRLQRLEPGRPYHTLGAIWIDGPLQVERLRAALQQVVDRHEILRTTFHTLDDGAYPVQKIAGAGRVACDVYDLEEAALAGSADPLDLLREAVGDRAEADDGSVLRVALGRISDRRHVLLVDLPALQADALTLKNLAVELGRACSASEPAQSAAGGAVQYADVAEVFNELIESPDTETGRLYWRRREDSGARQVRVPFEAPSARGEAFQPRWQLAEVDPAVLDRLEALARESRTSVETVLLAAWQTLLWRLTGQSDVSVGMAFDGRTDETLESALGLFTRYLPVSCSPVAALRFDALLQQVAQGMRDASQWQDYFFWEEPPGGAPSTAPAFFPLSFDFVDTSGQPDGGPLTFSLHTLYTCVDRFKLKLSGHRRPGSLRLAVHYDSALLTADDAQRLLHQLLAVLESAVTRPETAPGRLEYLGAAERHRLLVEFNHTRADYLQDRCFHHLFAGQAERTPDRVALVWGDRHLTFRELDARSNRLARHLQSRGVGPEGRAAICVERSLEMVVGVLGVLKAGGAEVPLDPGYPSERLAFMLADTQAAVILTQRHLRDRLPAHGVIEVCLDGDWETIGRESAAPVASPVTPDHLAYVIYTSGSTGAPKGVMVQHRSAVNYAQGLYERVYAHEGPAALQATLNAPLVFDASVKQLSLLLFGHTLHILSEHMRRDGEAFLAYVRDHHLDVVDGTPSLLRILLSAGLLSKTQPAPRVLSLGGEAIDEALWKLLQAERDLRAYNHYGPTECTVNTTICRIEPELETPALGRPLANTRVYLLDPHMQPVPLGLPGEIFIGGVCVSRGYLNRPELTAERFVPDPFAPTPPPFVMRSVQMGEGAGARLYKTGDLARYRPDGRLEFLGRVDHQVKIRGFRIELGEIEAALSQHPALHEVAVVARQTAQEANGAQDASWDKRLVAYVVPGEGAVISAGELRDFLSRKLPDYMVPTVFVTLPSLPLTPTGKVDRQALPAPDTPRSGTGKALVLPQTSIEKQLAQVWAQVLGLPDGQVGLHDNFFELGGDSLLCIQVVMKAAQVGLRFTPRQLFERQTVGELAAVVETNPAAPAAEGLVTGQVPLTPIQHWFFEQALPDPHAWTRSALLTTPPDAAGLLREVTQRLLLHHDALRSRFTPDPTRRTWQQVVEGAPDEVPFTCLDLSALSQPEQQRAVEHAVNDLPRALDLSTGPLLRAAFFDPGPGRPGRLLLASHALVLDGVSVRILAEDLEAIFRQLRRNDSPHLPPKTTSYKAWAEALTAYAGSDAVRQEHPYWAQGTGRAPSPWPVDFSESDTPGPARTVTLALTADETRALLHDVAPVYRMVTDEVLLTALALTFARWTGAPDLLVDVRAHGREMIVEGVDVSRTVGWFTTLHPVRLSVATSAGPGEALKAVKEQLRQAPKHGLGYGVLRYLGEEALAGPLRAQPQAAISFNYQGQFDQVLTGTSLFRPDSAFETPGDGLWTPRYLMEVQGGVSQGCLRLTWKYSAGRHRPATLERLAQSYLAALRELIAHCQSPEAGGYTPSDFSLAKLNQQDLNQIIAKVRQGKK